jgi:hypothetical protein
MSKPIHPIRKLLRALDLHHAAAASDRHADWYQSAVARHVKPLLDALKIETAAHVKPDDKFYDGEPMEACVCSSCRLLAAWRAKL